MEGGKLWREGKNGQEEKAEEREKDGRRGVGADGGDTEGQEKAGEVMMRRVKGIK